jgi:hypothetical protein
MWGIIVPVIAVLLGAGIFTAVTTAMKNSDAYKLAVVELQGDPQVTEILGAPIVTGFPMGNIAVSGPDGKASLSFSAEGPKGKGTVYVKAVETLGQWRVDQAVFEDGASKRRIDFN